MKPAAPSPRSRSIRRRATALAAILSAALLLVSSLPLASPAAAAAPKTGDVTLTILDVTPTSPQPSYQNKRLRVTFRLRNNTSTPLSDITITGYRSDPITSQQSLDDEIRRPSSPDPNQVAAIATAPVVQSVPEGGTVDGIYRTSVSIPQDVGVCLCADAIYPLYFTATSAAGSVLATAQTYIPSFDVTNPTKVQVGWVWPLLDRPHRLGDSSTFFDDDLAAEIAPGGRLDRALSVLEMVSATVPMTIVTDPDLLDELQVMADGAYTVTHTGKPSSEGVGTQDAANWLARLRAVLSLNSQTELDLTPFGDPNVEAVSEAGLTWSAGLNQQEQAEVSKALGGATALSDIAWPLNQTLSTPTLTTLVKQGARTVIVDNQTLPRGTTASPPPNALAPLTTTAGDAIAGVTSSTIDSWVAKVVSQGGDGTVDLPQLVAEVALRAVQVANNPQGASQSHYVLITPPRDLDVDPVSAAAAIMATADTYWSTPLPLRQAAQTLTPVSHGPLVPQKITALTDRAQQALRFVAFSLPGLTSLFTGDPADAATEIGTLPDAAQLATSSSLAADPAAATGYAVRLQHEVQTLREGVHLIDPANGSYTLTSNNSSIPVTVANDLTVPVRVNLDAASVGGLPGFVATPVQSRLIPARSTVQVRLRTHFDRAGRIEIAVRLSTPSGLHLGRPISLSVRSTALGTVGVVITAVAGFVLIVALLLRFISRRRSRKAKTSTA